MIGFIRVINDWKHLGDKIKSHEYKKEHLNSMQQWMDLSLYLDNGKILDHQNQNQILTEKERWRTVLKRIIVCILYLD